MPMFCMLTTVCWDEMTHAVNAGGNKAPPSTTTGMSASKLDNETEDFKREWQYFLNPSCSEPMCQLR